MNASRLAARPRLDHRRNLDDRDLTPLDGSWIASYGLPARWGKWYDEKIAPYGFMILIGLFILGLLRYYLAPFLLVGQWLLVAIAG